MLDSFGNEVFLPTPSVRLVFMQLSFCRKTSVVPYTHPPVMRVVLRSAFETSAHTMLLTYEKHGKHSVYYAVISSNARDAGLRSRRSGYD